MIRQILKPSECRVSLELPENYKGQAVEVVVFRLDEAAEPVKAAKSRKSTLVGLKGRFAVLQGQSSLADELLSDRRRDAAAEGI